MSKTWRESQKIFVGGVNSPVRAFRAVGGDPVIAKKGLGGRIWDENGKSYIDYCLSWGALILGHGDKKTARAVAAQAKLGTSFGMATPYELQLARLIQKAFPKMQKMRFTSSGTEAVMGALRLARGFTKKNRIVKFEGCYHGHTDSLLVRAGSGLATFGAPDSAGVPAELANLTTVLPYNDAGAVRSLETLDDLAAVIVEPVAGNMGVVPAKNEFLEALREITRKKKALLIFDEVISGFRVAYGGAQHLYGIEPDLTVLGKIIGGGLPVGAFGGREEIMKYLSPEGSVYQAGTLSGNPLSMAAGISVLSRLEPGVYKKMAARTQSFLHGAEKIFKRRKIPVSIQQVSSMYTIFLKDGGVNNFEDARRCHSERFKKLFHHLLSAGIYTPPSQFEASFLSLAHTQKDLDKTLKAFEAC